MSDRDPSTSRPHVVIIGGGYAGVMAAHHASSAAVDVTLIDATGRHGFLPRLATVAAGGGPLADAEAPLTDLLRGVTVHVGRVDAIDHRGHVVATTDGHTHDYDSLVVAAGAQAAPPDIPGLADHAWTLRSPLDAARLRPQIAAAESLVVVGAGSTGTQLAAEVAARHPRTNVTLVEMADRILPSLPPALADRAEAVLSSRGVAVRTRLSLKEVGPHGATFGDGTTAEGVVVWTGGFSTDGSVMLPDATFTDGRVVVDRCAQVGGHGPLFAAGDLAAHRGPGGGLLPQTAQVAVRAGKLAGANAVRVAEGRRARPTTLRHIGWVLPLGGGQAVAQIGPISLADGVTGRAAPLLHDLIDLRHLLNVGGLPAAVDHHQDR